MRERAVTAPPSSRVTSAWPVMRMSISAPSCTAATGGYPDRPVSIAWPSQSIEVPVSIFRSTGHHVRATAWRRRQRREYHTGFLLSWVFVTFAECAGHTRKQSPNKLQGLIVLEG